MTIQNSITFGVELEFLVPVLRPDEVDPAAGTDEHRPVTRVSDTRTPFSAVQVEIYALLKSHDIPVQNPPGSSAKVDKNGASVYLPQHWCIDEDRSVTERRKAFGYSWAAVELRSPALAANNDGYLHVLQVVTRLRERFRVRVNQSTGFHVHVGMGAEPLPPRVVHRLAQLLWCADGMLSSLHPPERVLGAAAAAPSIRHASHLARGEVDGWRAAQRGCETSTRDTRRGSLDESAAIRDRLLAVDQFPSLQRVAALAGRAGPEVHRPRAPVRDRGDEEAFVYYRRRAWMDTTEHAWFMLQNMDEIQQEVFGDWKFPKPLLHHQRDQSRDIPAKNNISWIMDTEVMVSSAWAELMNQELVPAVQNISLQEAAPEDSSALLNSSEQPFLTTGNNGKSSATITVQAHDHVEREAVGGSTEIFSNVRRNPYEDPGARARHLGVYGIDMPHFTEWQWLRDQAMVLGAPVSLLEGLAHLADPGLHQDTRRAAHLVSSAAGHRCNYNLDPYGFPAAAAAVKRPVMTAEFREATGSADPAWVAAWASICAGVVRFCLAAGRDEFVEVLMRVAEAEVNEGRVRARAGDEVEGSGGGRGRASLVGYDVVSFLADIQLGEEASYVDVMLGRQDKNAFWFPCDLVRKSVVGWQSPQAVGEGRAVLPPETGHC